MNTLALLISICFLSIEALNDRPIVGILSQETYSVNKYFPDEEYKSYIAASYVKFIESAGARVIPIWIGRDVKYYKNIVQKTNGILFPGGATWFNESGGYGDAGQMIYDIALDINKNGDYYPIFGICLGMELLAQVAINGKEIRDNCNAKKMSLPLTFKQNYTKSELFARAPKEVIEILSTEPVTYNYHQYCLTEKNFTVNGLDKDWAVLSTSTADVEFISSFESKEYPFFGIQFHPEKNIFEYKSSLNIPHSISAIKISQYFANFFVEETRKNYHKFDTLVAEQEALIYNYPPFYTGKKNSSYEQLYMFTKEINNGQQGIIV